MDSSLQSFIHLRTYSEYSIHFGMLRIDELMQSMTNMNMPAIAVTEHMNLFSVVKFYQAAISHGIKPIIGCHMKLQSAQDSALDDLVLLCQNITGYRHLTQLVTKAYAEGQTLGVPSIQWDWLTAHQEGLIVLSGGRKGDIGKAILDNKIDLAKAHLKRWQDAFPNCFYLEVQRLGHVNEAIYNQTIVTLADEFQLPLVATHEICFLERSDFEAHEARVCIHQGRIIADESRPKEFFPSQYLTSAEEMQKLFSDLPQALQNTIEIGKRCNLEMNIGKSYLPNFPTPNNVPEASFLEEQAKEGLVRRFEILSTTIDKSVYEKRLKHELNVIVKMGFSGYFLIVADFIQWSKDNGIPVGPGRGSGAGSLVAYALGITDLDPLSYDLLFERFLNPERVSMPDFDVDFCMVGRDKVIEYVTNHYGRENVAQIITFGTMAAKAVVRDVGRVLGHPYGFVDKLAKLIPFELGMTLATALSQEPELLRRYQEEEDVKELLDLAQKLEGITRNAGKHAGGVVIAPSKLTDFTAIFCEENSNQKVSQFDKDDVEAAGLVKFDFLGLRTLTIINDAIRMISQLTPDLIIDITRIPLDCKKTFALLQSGQTTGVFQLESRGMQELIKRLKPDCFEDIIALVALFRPGPLQSGMVDDFIDRKQGISPIVYLHPDLEPILKPTYGVILYQEQVMQIAQVLANYTLGAADLLRRAMGKKKPEEMAKQRSIFLEGAKSRAIKEDVATQIFDLMEKFAGYGFNKSHSAAYALVSYQTAWLKCHHPAPFMASVLSSDLDNTDKVVHMLKECQKMSLKVHRPCIQTSFYAFRVLNNHELYYGLGAIKGIGESVIDLIIEERDKNGSFKTLVSLCKRLDTRKMNKRVLEALIRSGSLDSIEPNRATLWDNLETAMKLGGQNWHNNQFGQIDLFTLFEDDESPSIKVSTPWPLQKMLAGEKETLGWYLSGHPSDEIVQEFKAFCVKIEDVNLNKTKVIRLCGLITEWRKMLTKRGKQMIIFTLSQPNASMELLLFPEKCAESAMEFSQGQLVYIEAEVVYDKVRLSNRISIQKLLSYEEARKNYAQSLVIKTNAQCITQLEDLQTLFALHPGHCSIIFDYQNQDINLRLKLGDNWNIEPSQAILESIQVLLGSKEVYFKYSHR